MRILAAATAIVIAATTQATAHIRDRPDLDEWTEGLRADMGPCCDKSEATVVADPDWDTACVPRIASLSDMVYRYRVRLRGRWVDVPERAVVAGPNRYGRALVWTYINYIGETMVRCFLPGAGT